jgi:hypothetical protein
MAFCVSGSQNLQADHLVMLRSFISFQNLPSTFQQIQCVGIAHRLFQCQAKLSTASPDSHIDMKQSLKPSAMVHRREIKKQANTIRLVSDMMLRSLSKRHAKRFIVTGRVCGVCHHDSLKLGVQLISF